MSLASRVLASNNQLPIRSDAPVHSGKVRSVYWLNKEDSTRLAAAKGYDVAPGAPLAVMVISDRISAFECLWRSESGMQGVPGKGAALNAISNHWFNSFREAGLADSHILDVPHPLVWIVQKARPVMVEAIARRYITGSMWRAYDKGEREICGIQLPDDLQKDQRLPELLITPSTKGVLTGIPDVPEADDVNITRKNLEDNLQAFNFNSAGDIDLYEKLLSEGFELISNKLAALGQIFVDTKFEFGYVDREDGSAKLIYMDEVGTPDSSRIWDAKAYEKGKVIENSKEGFRQALLSHFPDSDILTNKARMDERATLAKDNALPDEIMFKVSETYMNMAEKIIGEKLQLADDPKTEIVDVLNDQYGLIA